MGKKFLQKNELVIQHNNLIEARYSISLQEKRLILLMSSRIKKNDKEFQIYDFSVQELSNIFQINNKNIYREIDGVVSKLFTRVLTIKNLKEDSTTKISWLTYAKYWHGKGLIQLSFNEKLKPYFLEIQEKFTKISIGEIIGLKSIYAIRIFELLKQYEIISVRNFDLNDLRDYCGISNNKYNLYSNFKFKVLEMAKREINTKTKYIVDYTEIKESRKVVAIEWTIKKRNIESEEHLQKVAILEKELRSEQILIESLMEYGFSRQMAKRLIKNYNEKLVRDSIHVVNLQIERAHVKNPKALFLSSIKNGWNNGTFVQHKI